MRLHISGRDGNFLMGCSYFSHSTQGGWTREGIRAVGSFFFRLPPTVAGVLVSGSVGGMVGVIMGRCIEISFVWGGRDVWGTISSRCRYQAGIASTILGRVSIAAT
jgi:hypothetical protein